MSENNLFQFARVIADLPVQNTVESQEREAEASHHVQRNNHHLSYPRYLSIRKNACIVCSVCFTCSKYYGIDCTCQEVQPRRGKNLPEGGLDSRAKKLHREDPEDFKFSIKWLNENAHTMYKDENDNVVGLRDLQEVSLCKAHSSTLYRAKKRHERSQNLAPPSPADSNEMHYPYPLNHALGSGGLAAKVREISSLQPQMMRMQEMPDFSRMSHSTSNKRKRTYKPHKSPPKMEPSSIRPHSSISTPLYGSRQENMFMQPHVFTPNHSIQEFQPMPSQLPPLHHRTPPVVQNYPMAESPPRPTATKSMITPITAEPMDISPMVVETVSLRPSSSPDTYYFRNLAITDTFTFRDLLAEIDMTGSPPPGKRIVISDADKFYPLDQAIRSVIRRPTCTHLELCLGLTDKPSIDWSTYSS
ncbi:uncharacterized protein B0P05DRAFT_529023 [Gilbertella persicaria]|uniref:Uncharacterized protein n=1 Tax=Rhizopus stolonifer TaxID=4846 RepID=A0A367KM94_RHIST|nr:uncharacterized protein B0P05DRAFT_529023 [Gilbertella persicaria]KAI8091149.1 hypothetical protein B0P05DRAFT_529023 [Gilbertella persicaria]RCI03250.1 hypothetical protein CU098_010249 [Rhizopus stolonifer]